ETNYVPLPKSQYIALGRDFKALAEGQLDAQRVGHFISNYDYEITLKVAEVLSGGDIPRNTYVNKRYLQKLEKERFLELLRNKKSDIIEERVKLNARCIYSSLRTFSSW